MFAVDNRVVLCVVSAKSGDLKLLVCAGRQQIWRHHPDEDYACFAGCFVVDLK